MGAMQYRTAMAWQGKDEPDSVAPWFLRDAPGFQIVSELAPRPEDAVFDKITMSAFEGTPLAIALRDCGISSIAIVGIATDLTVKPVGEPDAGDRHEVGIEPTARCGGGDEAAAQRSLESLRFAGDAIISDT